MKSNVSIVAVICLVVGFVCGYYFTKDSHQSQTDMTSPMATSDQEDGIRKLQDLTETEIAEYYRLKTMEERYAKAEELLGKMMTIFLADLGIKLSPETKLAMEQPLPPLSQQDPQTMAPASNSSALSQKNIITKGIGEPVSGLQLNRKSLDDLRSDADIEKFLKDSELESVDDTLKNSKAYSNKSGTLEALQGTFTGSGPVREDGKNKTWDYELIFNGRIEKGALKGSHSIRISEDGNVFNNSKGRGDLSGEYRELPNDPEAILVEAGPKTILQMYYLKSADAMIGNVFRKENAREDFKNIGRFRLTR